MKTRPGLSSSSSSCTHKNKRPQQLSKAEKLVKNITLGNGEEGALAFTSR